MELHQVQRPPARPTRYEAPGSLDEALALLAAEPDATRPIAGGTDLIVELDRGAHDGVTTLIDLGRVPGLDTIALDGDTLRLGALVTHNQVVADGRCRDLALPLAQACLEVGSPQLRNRATVAGNVVTASPANDTISALLALGASVELASAGGGSRTLTVGDFITGFRQTQLDTAELVTAITVPALRPPGRGIFVKLGLRRAQAISVVHLAATIHLDNDGIVTDATMALGSVAPTVVLVDELADTLRGRQLDAEAIADGAAAAARTAAPIDDLRATAEYRQLTVETMAERALAALAADIQSSRWPSRPPLLWTTDFDGSFPTGAANASTNSAGDPVSATVNGASVTAPAHPGETLLDWLRTGAAASGVKEGCAEGECGACTVELDGAAVMSCLVPAPRAAGATIVTVEGLASSPADLHPIQDAFIDHGAVQCGFCTPGLLVAGAALLDEIPAPTATDVRDGLAGNLCRCTGYVAIERAVLAAASEASDE